VVLSIWENRKNLFAVEKGKEDFLGLIFLKIPLAPLVRGSNPTQIQTVPKD
jgi:hypothetical protein